MKPETTRVLTNLSWGHLKNNAPGGSQDMFAPVLDIPLKTSANVAQGAGASLTRHEDGLSNVIQHLRLSGETKRQG